MTNKKLPIITVDQVKAELCRRDFFYFLKEFIHVTIKEEIVWNWHIEFLCEKLQEYGKAIINREPFPKEYLIINVPPGSSKSTIVSQFFPVWLWINDPTAVTISLSYSQNLSIRHGMRSRDIMNDEKFKRYFPHIKFKPDQNNKMALGLEQGGVRIISSVGGTITGDHAHCLIIDDPLNVEESTSDAERSNANDFIRHTLPTRKKNSKLTPTIIVMQRLHEADPTGMLLEEMPELCEHICLPSEIDNNIRPTYLKEMYVDGLLDPVRVDKEVIESKRKALGSYHYAGQYLQKPAPSEGGIIKKDYFKIIDQEHCPKGTVNFVVDSAYTEDERNDPSGYLSYIHFGNSIYITNFHKGYYDFNEQIKKLPEFAKANNYNNQSVIYVEPKASGKDLVSILKKQSNLNIKEDKSPTKDKEARVNDIVSFLEAGRVFLVRGGWNTDFITQCATFPNAKHDEEVDCLVMAARRSFLKSKLKFI